MEMTDMFSFIILGIIVVAFVIYAIVVTKKQKANASKFEDQQREADKIAKKLEITKQHLKYKNLIIIKKFLTAAVGIFLALTLIFFMFLPIFRIQLEFEGEVLLYEDFSILDNYTAMANEKNEAARCFVNVDPFLQLINFIILAVFLLFTVIRSIIILMQNSEKETLIAFTFAKTDLTKDGKKEEIYNCLFSVCLGLQILLIIMLKYNEFNYSANFEYYINNEGRYLVYRDAADGSILLKVFQNNFIFCNAVSPQLALPIVAVVIAIGLIAAVAVINRKLEKAIKNEEIIEPEPEDITETQKIA